MQKHACIFFSIRQLRSISILSFSIGMVFSVSIEYFFASNASRKQSEKMDSNKIKTIHAILNLTWSGKTLDELNGKYFLNVFLYFHLISILFIISFQMTTSTTPVGSSLRHEKKFDGRLNQFPLSTRCRKTISYLRRRTLNFIEVSDKFYFSKFTVLSNSIFLNVFFNFFSENL